MSIQDDIFDVQDSLKRKKDVTPALDRILSYLYALEEQNDIQGRLLSDIKSGAQALKQIWKLNDENVESNR